MGDNISSSPLSDAGIWKAWSIVCIAEAGRQGFAPLGAAQVHVLLYLANTLASFFEVTRVRGRVLKRGAYPFYPEVQRELDRMAFSGALLIDRVDFGPRGHLAPHYSIGPVGEQICKSLLLHSEEAKRTSHLFAELIGACFGRFLESDAAIGPIDANYGNADVLEGEVVDFSEWQDENKNMQVARYLIEHLQSLRPDPRRDGVRLYCDYLDKALALQ